MPITLRDVTAEDEDFLREVYASSREPEMAMVDWSSEQREAFLRFQFDAQDSYYRAQFSSASFQIVLNDGERVGRLYVLRDGGEIKILDITVLPRFRSNGIGSHVIEQILTEAARGGEPVKIWIEQFNPSQNLFRRLGFSVIAEDGYNQLLEFRSTAQKLTTAS